MSYSNGSNKENSNLFSLREKSYYNYGCIKGEYEFESNLQEHTPYHLLECGNYVDGTYN